MSRAGLAAIAAAGAAAFGAGYVLAAEGDEPAGRRGAVKQLTVPPAAVGIPAGAGERALPPYIEPASPRRTQPPRAPTTAPPDPTTAPPEPTPAPTAEPPAPTPDPGGDGGGGIIEG